MSSLSRSPTDRNSSRNYIRFRVFSHTKGDVQLEFSIKLKDITWDNFLVYLFGSQAQAIERQQPTIILLGDKHKIVLRNTNIKQLISDALTKSFKGSCVNLLVPDFDKVFVPNYSAGQLTLKDDEFRRKTAEIKDFAEIFSKRMDLPSMDQFVQSVPHVRFMRVESDGAARVELPARENLPQLGELHVKRLNDGDLANLLKDGASVILQTSDNKLVSVKFNNDQLPTFNETRCKYRKFDSTYQCSDLKIPVLLDDDVRFLFNQDAEFVQKMMKTMETAEQKQKEHLIRLKRLQESMKKIKTVKETSVDPAAASTSCSASTAAAEAPTPSVIPPALSDPLIPQISEGSSNEGAQTASRVYRRPHRSAQKRSKRCIAISAIARAAVESPSSLNRDRDSILAALQEMSVSGSPSRCLGLAAGCHSSPQQTAKPGPSKAVTTGAQQNATPDPPAWFGELLDKFKSEVLQEVKSMVKNVLDTSIPPQSASNLKTLQECDQDDDQYQFQALDGSPSAGKHKQHDKQHHSGGASFKRKSASLCSKRGGGVIAENKTVTLFAERILEISPNMFVYSKSGFKVRMPRNASLTIQMSVCRAARYRVLLEEIDLRVLSVSHSIECCVKPTSATYAPVRSPMFNNLYTIDPPINYDVRIKSKDKSGKFRLYFNVMSNGRNIGHSFKIDVRVKKEYTLPFVGTEGTLNYENDESAVPLPESNPMPSTSSVLNFAESQKSSTQQSSVEISDAVAAAAAAAAELADEGIGGNQEDFFSPTSDSEFSDVSDSKPDALLKDEGIDTCYRSMVNSENGATPKCAHPDLDSDSDTDSSISFLMDEDEARDELNDALDVIQLPSCFIPRVKLTEDVLPVRIKRKHSSATKRNAANETTSSVDSLPPPQQHSPQQQQQQQHHHHHQQQQQDVTSSAFGSNIVTPVSTAAVPTTPSTNVAATHTTCATMTTTTSTPAVTISDDDDEKDISFLNESMKTAAVDHAYHRSLYPNLQGLKECVHPAATSGIGSTAAPATTEAKPSATESPPKPQQTNAAAADANPTASEQYPSILPEKLFEMWKNATVPIPKQIHETVSYAANAARAAAANAAAAAANIVPNVPTPPSPVASSLLNELDKAQKYAFAAANEAAAAANAAVKNGIPMPAPPASSKSSSYSSARFSEWNDGVDGFPAWNDGLDKASGYVCEAASNFVSNPFAWTSASEGSNDGAGGEASATVPESQPSAADAQNRSSDTQPSKEKRQKYVSSSFAPQKQRRNNSNGNEAAHEQQRKTDQSGNDAQKQRQNNSSGNEAHAQQQQQNDHDGNGAHVQSMYKNLSVEMQHNLIALHEMGFNDDPYMIYLLEQYPNDLNKVVESLINYSTY